MSFLMRCYTGPSAAFVEAYAGADEFPAFVACGLTLDGAKDKARNLATILDPCASILWVSTQTLEIQVRA